MVQGDTHSGPDELKTEEEKRREQAEQKERICQSELDANQQVEELKNTTRSVGPAIDRIFTPPPEGTVENPGPGEKIGGFEESEPTDSDLPLPDGRDKEHPSDRFDNRETFGSIPPLPSKEQVPHPDQPGLGQPGFAGVDMATGPDHTAVSIPGSEEVSVPAFAWDGEEPVMIPESVIGDVNLVSFIAPTDTTDVIMIEGVRHEDLFLDADTGEVLGIITPGDGPFVVKDRESAEWVLRKITEAEAAIKAEAEMLEVVASRIKGKIKALKARSAWFSTRFKSELAVVAKASLQGKKRNVDFTWGRIGFRKSKEKLEVEDKDKAIGFLEDTEGCEDAVKTEKSVLIRNLPPEVRHTLLNSPLARKEGGFTWTPADPDVFYIKTGIEKA